MAIGQVAGLAGNKCNWSKNDNWYLKLCNVHAGTFAAEKLKRSSKKTGNSTKKMLWTSLAGPSFARARARPLPAQEEQASTKKLGRWQLLAQGPGILGC